jgi:hypothetical protein
MGFDPKNDFMNKKLMRCALASLVLLSACGGGGSSGAGSAPVVPATTVSLLSVALTPTLSSPEFITRSSDGYLYVTDASNNVRKISVSGGAASSLPAVALGAGVALSSANNLYYLANHNLYFLDQTASNVSTPIYTDSFSNFAGLAFAGASAYFSNGGEIQIINSVRVGTSYANATPCSLSPAQPIGIATDGSSFYATLDSGKVLHTPLGACPSALNASNTFTDNTHLLNPKGIVVVGNTAYVVNNGTPGADDGSISKIDLNPGALNPVTTFMDSTSGNWPAGHVGFCDPYGIAVEPDGSYIYVTNRSACSANIANQNTILKIKL